MFLKNKNITFKIRRSKVTDIAALNKANSFESEALLLNLNLPITDDIISFSFMISVMILI